MAIIKKEQEYKDFSWDLHQKLGHKPIVAQMELTFRCPLHCQHCYTDCYNNKKATKKELSLKKIKEILDKCKKDGVVWFCFTGGDPLLRKDFTEIYTYAKKLGFITSVFTSLIPLNKKILQVFKRYSPFNIETTLNAATSREYQEITKTKFFKKHIEAIKKLLKNNLAIRVKTQVTKQNVGQIDRIKKLVESFGLKFRPSTMIHARLNQDIHPCNLRLEPKEAIRINKNYGYFEEDDARQPYEKFKIKDLISKKGNSKLLTCAAGGHSFWISPQGKMFICSSIREPDYDLLKKSHTVKEGFYRLNKKVHNLHFITNSRCHKCKYRLICQWCPGRAYLETGDLEKPIDYFCQVAHSRSSALVKESPLSF